ncbi:oxidoreductase [Streptomyces zingiberis]|uniref:SDR family NAD(P)-dependent oxidoreductase n=1 Tax=Streptomyces zingiberis TaxID=2053010 RepID=A0ABX1C117_9ACTN|nr:oxidoreductase [Streptomyces zingiberis]NJQ03617.1 SDR family NAD(P)-dependent oxidoreductase [Streptomyces zingiberis]
MPLSPPDLGPVLITGASKGIGAASASRLVRAGHTVYATARDIGALAELEKLGARPLPLDVTDEESMRTAVGTVVELHGRVGALVNNAGYGAYGAFEEIPMSAVRAQFETNVFGLMRLVQLVLPSMRAAGRGRIVNVSSVAGRLTLPFSGAYHGSKYAVEALSDTLRAEVAPFGIEVSVIEPGPVATPFLDTAMANLTDAVPPGSVYHRSAAAFGASTVRSYRNRRVTAGPDAVAATIERALTARRPRTRYAGNAAARALITTRALLPGRAWDGVVRRGMGI